jgi:hypothetical protein
MSPTDMLMIVRLRSISASWESLKFQVKMSLPHKYPNSENSRGLCLDSLLEQISV